MKIHRNVIVSDLAEMKALFTVCTIFEDIEIKFFNIIYTSFEYNLYIIWF